MSRPLNNTNFYFLFPQAEKTDTENGKDHTNGTITPNGMAGPPAGGLGYTVKPAEAAREHVVEAGKSGLLNPHAGAQVGRPDRPPSANREASGRNALTPNTQ